MSEPTDSTRPEFWDIRYQQGRTPWDMQGIPSALRRFITSSPPGSVLIPGCGSAYEVEAFTQAGWDVTAIDFSPPAVEQARARLGELARCVVLGDFFRHDLGEQRFDVVYERTFLCALPPSTWTTYAARMGQLLRAGGVLAGIFLQGDEPEPPPYPLTEKLAQSLFGNLFTLERNEPVEDSLPLFRGKERWQIWKRL